MVGHPNFRELSETGRPATGLDSSHAVEMPNCQPFVRRRLGQSAPAIENRDQRKPWHQQAERGRFGNRDCRWRKCHVAAIGPGGPDIATEPIQELHTWVFHPIPTNPPEISAGPRTDCAAIIPTEVSELEKRQLPGRIERQRSSLGSDEARKNVWVGTGVQVDIVVRIAIPSEVDAGEKSCGVICQKLVPPGVMLLLSNENVPWLTAPSSGPDVAVTVKS
jgi:hypothetical protein